MTIAIGARCSDGVIVCADSEFTYGEIQKAYDKKVYEFAEPDWSSRLIMAFAGSVQFARMFIESTGRALAALADKSADNIEDLVADSLLGFHKKQIHQHPKLGLYGGPDFSLIVGIKGVTGGLRLLSSQDSAIAPIEVCGSVGVGEYLVRYLLRGTYFPSLDMESAHLKIRDAMNETKINVPGVGGRNQFFLLGEKCRSVII